MRQTLNIESRLNDGIAMPVAKGTLEEVDSQ
jgi:hypothetical protein